MNSLHQIINLVSPFIVSFLNPVPKTLPVILPPVSTPPPPVIERQYQSESTTILASWYGPGFIGNETANGEIFNNYDLTVAHPYLPFGTMLEITYRGNKVVARVNDRGPYAGNRGIDLSPATAQTLGFDGVDDVQVVILK